MANTGSYSIDDLLAQRFSSAADFGLDTINKVLQADLDYYNAEVTEQLRLLAEPMTEQQRIYGTSAMVDMVEIDEFGAAPTKKNLTGVTCGFPLHLYSSSLGWTSKYLEIATPAEVAAQYLQVRKGHAAKMTTEIKKAIFNNANFTFVDKLTNGVSLGVKRFINADSSVIPNSPAGVSFDGTSHTHYLARVSTLANSDIDGLVSTINEHGHTKGLMIVIALGDKAAISALTGFKKLSSPELIYNATDATVAKLDMGDLENQMIGLWNETIPVWVKPWAVANYVLCVATGSNEKVLAFRQRPQTALQGLRIVAEINDYPLIAKSMESEYGFGVWNRLAGAVLYTGGTSWVNPTL
jgi:hypothetical protein